MEYAILFILSFGITLLSIPFLKRVAVRYHLVDVATGDALKIHREPISFFGGVALFVAITITWGGAALWKMETDWRVAGILVAALLIFALGFWDDLKWKHIAQRKPYTKFFLLLTVPLLASFILVRSGVDMSFLEVGSIAVVVVFLYIFTLINAVNYQDGMDGLAGGLVAISLFGFIVAALFLQNAFVLSLVLPLCGAVLGFLVFNFPPARIFMGDSGAYMLGFFLVVVALLFSHPDDIASVIGPLFIIGVPLIEGLLSNARRVVAGKSIFLGDRDHIYDRMLQKGYSTRQTLSVFYLLQAVFVAFGIWILI